MAEEKKKLSAKEVVMDIRAGAADEFLMKKYGISDKGLQSLFQKLITAKVFTQADLDRRSARDVGTVIVHDDEAKPVHPTSTSTQTVFRCPACNLPQSYEFKVCPQCGIIVEKFLKKKANGTAVEKAVRGSTNEQPEQPKEGDQVPVSQILADIKSGADFRQLIEKYGFHAETLQRILTKMLFAGLLNPSEISALQPPVKSGPPVVDRPRIPRRIPRKYKVLAAVLPIALIVIAGGVYGVRHYMDVKAKQETLIKACTSGELDKAAVLLADGTDPNCASSDGSSVLSLASAAGHTPVVKVLLDYGADPNLGTQAERNRTAEAWRQGFKKWLGYMFNRIVLPLPKTVGEKSALLEAAAGDHRAVMRLLINNGANVRVSYQDGITPLMAMASKGDASLVRLLMEKGSQLNAKDREGNSALMFAAAQGHRDVVALLLQQGVSVNLINAAGDTPLIMAASAGDVESVGMLLQAGAEINVENAKGYTAVDVGFGRGISKLESLLTSKGGKPGAVLRRERMLAAATNGDVKTLKAVLSKKTDVNYREDKGDPALILATRNGHKDAAKVLLDNGADVDATDREGGRTSLILAYLNKDYDTLDMLLTKGANPALAGKDGKTLPPMAACEGDTRAMELLCAKGPTLDMRAQNRIVYSAVICGKPEVLDLLARQGIDLDAKNAGGETVLCSAAYLGLTNMVGALLDKGADINVPEDQYGWTPLMIAVGQGHDAVAKLLFDRGADCNYKAKDGETVLMVACRKGNAEMVKGLLEKKIDVNVADQQGRTAFGNAVSATHLDLAQLLLNAGFRVDSKSKEINSCVFKLFDDGQIGFLKTVLASCTDPNVVAPDREPLLMKACSKLDLDFVTFLIEKGANVNAADMRGRTSLHLATEGGHRDLIDLLLAKGADVNTKDRLGRTVLLTALDVGRGNVTDLLLERRADVNLQDQDGRSPLMVACDKGQVNLVKAFLEKGANLNASTKAGRTALMAASKSGHQGIVELLVDKGADVEARDKEGKSALSIAMEARHLGISDLLLETMKEKRKQQKGADNERKRESLGPRGAGGR